MSLPAASYTEIIIKNVNLERLSWAESRDENKSCKWSKAG
jgi:hypothetical protein